MTNRKTSLESNRNYNTAMFTLTISEKHENDDICSLLNECLRSDQYPFFFVLKFGCHVRERRRTKEF